MLPWLLVRIGTATSVEGKLEETVVQESNSISEQNVMRTKLSQYSMEDSGFPESENRSSSTSEKKLVKNEW